MNYHGGAAQDSAEAFHAAAAAAVTASVPAAAAVRTSASHPDDAAQLDTAGHISKLYAYIQDLGGALPPGWTAEVKLRNPQATGSQGGQAPTTPLSPASRSTGSHKDVYYISPQGKRFRSRTKVAQELGLSAPEPSGKGSGGSSGTAKSPTGGANGFQQQRAAAVASAQQQRLSVDVSERGKSSGSSAGLKAAPTSSPRSATKAPIVGSPAGSGAAGKSGAGGGPASAPHPFQILTGKALAGAKSTTGKASGGAMVSGAWSAASTVPAAAAGIKPKPAPAQHRARPPATSTHADKDEVVVRSIIDKCISRIEVAETKAAEKAAAVQQRAAERAAERAVIAERKAAERAAERAAAVERRAEERAAARSAKRAAKRREKALEKQLQQEALPPVALLPGQSAAPAARVTHGPVDEGMLPDAMQAPPAPEPLDLAPGLLAPDDVDRLMQVWELLSAFGGVLGLHDPSPTLPDLVAMVISGWEQPAAEAAVAAAAAQEQAETVADATAGRAEDEVLADADGAKETEKTSSAAAADSSATTSAPAAPTVAAANGPVTSATLPDGDDTIAGSWGLEAAAVRMACVGAGAARKRSETLHLDLAKLLPGEVVHALGEWIKADAFLTKRDLASSRCLPWPDARTWPESMARYFSAAACAHLLALQHDARPPGAADTLALSSSCLSHLPAPDWQMALMAGLNAQGGLSRVAMLPQGSSKSAAEVLMHIDDAQALTTAELVMKTHLQRVQAAAAAGSSDLLTSLDPATRLATPSGPDEVEAAKRRGDVRLGRRLLAHLLVSPSGSAVSSRKDTGAMGMFAEDLSGLAKATRPLDLHAVACRLQAGLYSATGCLLDSMAADVRHCCGLWRAALSPAAPHGHSGELAYARPPEFESASADLADELEARLQAFLADAASTPGRLEELRSPAQKQLKARETKGKPGAGDDDQTSPDGLEVEAGGLQVDAGESHEKEDGDEEGSREVAAVVEEREEEDVFALDEPDRPFSYLEGCRACWRNEDQARMLLCDGCDDAYHMYCLEPPLLQVPEHGWYCPVCVLRNEPGGTHAGHEPSPRQLAGIELPGGIDSRAGIPAVRELLEMAQRLRSLEYFPAAGEVKPVAAGGARSQAPAGAAHDQLAAACGYAGSWTPSHRIRLLQLVAELAVESGQLRRHLDGAAERRRDARKQAADIKAAARARELAAAEAEAAKQLPPAAAAGVAASAHPFAATSTYSEVPAGQQQLQQDQQQLQHRPVVKLASNASVLTAEERKQVAQLDRAAERFEERRECLGVDRKGNRYWWLGSQRDEADGTWLDPGCVFVESQMSPGGEGRVGDGSVRWGLYPSARHLDALLAYLNPQGLVEGPLRQALSRVRQAQAACLVKKDAAAKEDINGEGRHQQQGGPGPAVMCLSDDLRSSAGPAAVGAGSAAAAGACGGAGGTAHQAAALEDVSHEAVEAAAVKAELYRVYHSLPESSFAPFWGSDERQAQWVELVSQANSPRELAAATSLLELMVSDQCMKPHWRYWAMPAQHPGYAGTWSACWYRLQGFQAALKKGGAAAGRGGGGAPHVALATRGHQRAGRDEAGPAGTTGGGGSGRSTGSGKASVALPRGKPVAALVITDDGDDDEVSSSSSSEEDNDLDWGGTGGGGKGKKRAAGRRRQGGSSDEEDEEEEEVERDSNRKGVKQKGGGTKAVGRAKKVARRAGVPAATASKKRGRGGSEREGGMRRVTRVSAAAVPAPAKRGRAGSAGAVREARRETRSGQRVDAGSNKPGAARVAAGKKKPFSVSRNVQESEDGSSDSDSSSDGAKEEEEEFEEEEEGDDEDIVSSDSSDDGSSDADDDEAADEEREEAQDEEPLNDDLDEEEEEEEEEEDVASRGKRGQKSAAVVDLEDDFEEEQEEDVARKAVKKASRHPAAAPARRAVVIEDDDGDGEAVKQPVKDRCKGGGRGKVAHVPVAVSKPPPSPPPAAAPLAKKRAAANQGGSRGDGAGSATVTGSIRGGMSKKRPAFDDFDDLND